MPKQGEIDYVKNLDACAVRHAQGKPFTDPACGQHFLNLGLIFSLLPPPPARVLDLGIGAGWTSTFLAQRGYYVVGVDIAPDMIALAQQQIGNELNLHFLAADYERLEYRDEFDAAIFYDALHHAEDELEALAGAHRALKAGGVCITVEPGSGHALSALDTVTRFGVTEKDMPPARIIELGQRIGFQEFRIYPRPEVHPTLVEPAGDGPITRYLRAFARNLAKAIVGPNRQRRHWLDNSHIVWMRK